MKTIVIAGTVSGAVSRNLDTWLLASYIHLHLGSLPGMARRFIESCRKFREWSQPRGLS